MIARFRRPQAPGPRGWLVLGSLPALVQRGLYRLVMETWQEYGLPFRLRLGPQRITFLADPAQIAALVAHQRQLPKGKGFADLRRSVLGNGIVASDGKRWRHDRQVMQPLFSHQAVGRFAPVMVEEAQALAERWRLRLAESRRAVDVLEEMQRLTQRIILRCLFSERAGEEVGAAFNTVIDYISQLGSGAGILHQVLPTSKRRAYQQASTRLVAYARKCLHERRHQTTRPDDVLTRLIEAASAADYRLSDEDIIAQMLTLWYAGHETQTLVFTWAWYELATHPEAEQALHQELATVLHGRPPRLADLPRLVYTLQVFKELLRKHPPAWMFPREVAAALDLNGVHLNAGTLVMACPHLTHRLPEYWPDPEAFLPERFAPGQAKDDIPFAYYPFGIGQRTCLGQSFATQEFLLVLATLAQQVQLRPRAGFAPQLYAAGTLRLRAGMPMTLQPRGIQVAPEAACTPADTCPVHPPR